MKTDRVQGRNSRSALYLFFIIYLLVPILSILALPHFTRTHFTVADSPWGRLCDRGLTQKDGHLNRRSLAFLLASEVKALLIYMPDLRHYILFSTFWNTGVWIGESRTLTPESFDLDGLRPFVKVPDSGHPA